MEHQSEIEPEVAISEKEISASSSSSADQNVVINNEVMTELTKHLDDEATDLENATTIQIVDSLPLEEPVHILSVEGSKEIEYHSDENMAENRADETMATGVFVNDSNTENVAQDVPEIVPEDVSEDVARDEGENIKEEGKLPLKQRNDERKDESVDEPEISESFREEKKSNELLFNTEIVTELSNHNFEHLDMVLLSKLVKLPTTSGQRYFRRLESDRQIRSLFTALRNADALNDNMTTTIEDDWEFEDSSFYEEANELWKNLSKEKKDSILEVVTQVASLLLNTSTQQQRIRQATLNGSKGVGEKPEQRQREEVDSAGLFTANFEWNKLPPALKTVYNKQGQRHEVIDGQTFWKFLNRCTVDVEGTTTKRVQHQQQQQQQPLSDNESNDEYEDEDDMTPDRFMEMIGRLMQNAKLSKEDLSNRVEDLDTLEKKEEVSRRESSSGESHDVDETQQQLLQKVLADLQGDEAEGEQYAMQALMQMLQGGQLFQDTSSIPEDIKLKQLNEILAERRRDPNQQHVADVWDEILQAGLDHDGVQNSPMKTSRLFGIRTRLRSLKEKWKERKRD